MEQTMKGRTDSTTDANSTNRNSSMETKVCHDVKSQSDAQRILGDDGHLYRRSAQAILVNEKDEILVFVPMGKCNARYLQCPQGGIELGEDSIEAAIRETLEETGIDLNKFAKLIGPVWPQEAHHTSTPTVSVMHFNKKTQKEELVILDERKKQFRYYNKTWRNLGIVGQELCPVLFRVHSSCIKFVDCRPRLPHERRTFKKPQWTTLEKLPESTQESKRTAITNISKAAKTTLQKLQEEQNKCDESLITEFVKL